DAGRGSGHRLVRKRSSSPGERSQRHSHSEKPRMSWIPGSFSGEALEIGHLALHFLAGGVRSGTDALNAQTEFVRIGRAHEGFLERDELLVVEIKERLIEGLHAVLRSAGGDGVVDEARFVRVDDAIADVGG